MYEMNGVNGDFVKFDIAANLFVVKCVFRLAVCVLGIRMLTAR